MSSAPAHSASDPELNFTQGSLIALAAYSGFYLRKSCHGSYGSFITFQLVLIIICAWVSASRVYAISRRNWYLAIITFGLGLVPVGTNLRRVLGWPSQTSSTQIRTLPHSHYGNSSLRNSIRLNSHNRYLVLRARFIIATISNSAGSYTACTPTRALFLMNFIDIFTFRLNNRGSDGKTYSISSILISRFLIYLRQTNQGVEDQSIDLDFDRSRNLAFAMMTVGNTRPIIDTTLATSISAQSQTIDVSAEDTLGKQDNEIDVYGYVLYLVRSMLKRVDPVFIYMPVFHRQMASEDPWTRKTSATSTSYEVRGGGRHLYHQQRMFALSRSLMEGQYGFTSLAFQSTSRHSLTASLYRNDAALSNHSPQRSTC
ncbi:hypothetical protein POSPLADRAFT_1036854 [Postia placenta MAD-698-R-SB12]|uniref:Uncharacterized protein n=1 Tax=Postia placenta MAD-698-R-SB12 TaxID=670580 RepID=A0A1X6MLN9_9APHY|nr:hypothetical protein POSPLADRAFT_1036854 [Postia placenta MAD-698-R-SB12]OSX57351.1 hypothetical protein POSPLADRAFT_1036854 [Postia placenta MAD-698-R-SB12]